MISQEKWNLDKIAPQEEVSIAFTAIYSTSTPPGVYTNYAQVVASSSEQYGQTVTSNVATSTVVILSADMFGGGRSHGSTTVALSTKKSGPAPGIVSEEQTLAPIAEASAISGNDQVANVGSFWNFPVSPYWLIFPILGLVSLALLRKGGVRQFARIRNKFTIF